MMRPPGMIVPAILVAVLLPRPASVSADTDEPSLSISVNGEPRATDAAYYTVHPGRSNRLEVRFDRRSWGGDALVASLTRTLPDGRTDEQRLEVGRGDDAIVFDLGAFAAPAEYDFERGVVYRRGYRFTLRVTSPPPTPREAIVSLHQGPARRADAEALWLGDSARHVYNSDQTGAAWVLTKDDQGTQMDPPFICTLDWAALADPDDVRVRLLHRLGPDAAPVAGRLVVTRVQDHTLLLDRAVEIGATASIERVDVSLRAEGDYRIELQPAVRGTMHREGPSLVYHRSRGDASAVPISPLAPWRLRRDESRNEIVVDDFAQVTDTWSAEFDATDWTVGKTVTGRGDVNAAPFVLVPRLSGKYAIFARSSGCCYLRAGKDPIVRRVGTQGHSNTFPSPRDGHFVVVTDMTDGRLAIHQSGAAGTGLVALRLVPVTAASATSFAEETSRPPLPLAGVCDWLDYFYPAEDARVAADQFESLVETHAELGIRDIHWAAGRSVLLYHSHLPQASIFPATPSETVPPSVLESYPHFGPWAALTRRFCPLSEVTNHRDRHGVRIQPWLAMQRHYGPHYGGLLMSRWFGEHPEWHEWTRHGARPSESTICYFFPEVRRERVDILCELAERCPDGLLVDGTRQPPMLGYHPQMVAAYVRETGVDPRTLDASAAEERDRWFRWRANFFTETLRELKARLAPIRRRVGREIPVIVRIPSAGLPYSMAQGFDVETWCRERLLDRLELEPLEDFGGRGSHDVGPYVEIGRRHAVSVWAGINANTMRNATAVMKRALGLHEAGVAGLYFFESSNFSGTDPIRWLIPLLGHRGRLADFLETSNVEACDPVTATNCCSGFDNHSRFDGPSTTDILGRLGKTAL